MLDWNKIGKMLDEVTFAEPSKRTIELRRRELVWEERRCEYTEEHFDNWKAVYKAWLTGLNPVPQEVIDKLDELTFDVLCDYIDYENNTDAPYDEEKNALFDSFSIKLLGHTFDLLDAAKQDVRELNWDCDICDTDYADDYDEDWIVA